ncbi:hypothetical protein [Streptomyces alboflavus]|uniref:hypothetical protein n=1 Tax=Streptomyces alboflavus TaxID=67267 RepID=UPI000F6589AE|nr:hypothetical protein [Streptomyces alboflavus]
MAQQFDQETRELHQAFSQTLADAVRLAILVATLVAEHRVEQREREFARQQEAEAAQARAAMEQLRAERAAAEPLLRAVHQERFWRGADARRIGRAWQAASEWAGSDPYAAFTLDVLRKELAERLGIEVPAWPVQGAELSRFVTVSDPEFRTVLEQGRAAAESSGEASYVVLVRDLQDEFQTAGRWTVNVPRGMRPETAAAREFEKWAAGDGAAQVGERGTATFVVELVENTGEVRAAHVPAVQLSGDRASEVLASDVAWQRALVSGAEQGSDAELLYALDGELERLEAEERHRQARRTEYAERLETEALAPADRKRLEGNVAAIDEGLPGLRQQQADTALRMAATSAGLRGEDPRHVYDAAQLRESLDDGWWTTASAREVAGVWEHVEGWSPGQAREGMHAWLREEIEQHHHILVPREASADVVAGLYGGRDMPGVATPLTHQGEVLREQSRALFEESWADLDRAHRLYAEADEQSGRYADELRRQAAMTTERGLHTHGHAALFEEQAQWMDEQAPETMGRIYQEGNAQAAEALAAEFEARWGRPLGAEAREQLTEAVSQVQQGGALWTVQAGAGSVDPVVIPGTVVHSAPAEPAQPGPGQEEMSAGSSGAPGDAELTGDPAAGLGAEEARHAAAEAARAALPDQDLADALRVSEKAFPQSPDAATAGGGTGSGPGAAPVRERAIQMER